MHPEDGSHPVVTSTQSRTLLPHAINQRRLFTARLILYMRTSHVPSMYTPCGLLSNTSPPSPHPLPKLGQNYESLLFTLLALLLRAQLLFSGACLDIH